MTAEDPRSPPRRDRARTLWLSGTALGSLILAGFLPALAPLGFLPRPWLLLLLGTLALAGAFHRPLGGNGLGVGAALLPTAVVLCGTVPAAALAGLVAGTAALARGRFVARSQLLPPERRGIARALAGGAGAALAVLAAGAAWTVLGPGRPLDAEDERLLAAALLSLLAYAALAVGAELVAAGGDAAWPLRLRRALPPVLLDAAAWLVGTAGVLVADRLSLRAALVLLAGPALVAAEAARHARLRGVSERRAEDLQKLTSATARMPETGRPMTATADQLRVECANVVPFHWFQFEMPGADGVPLSWRSRPEGPLEEGVPEPGAAPPALPGFHRRGAWEKLDRELRVEGRTLARIRLWCDPRQVDAAARTLLDELVPQMAASVERSLLDREAKNDALTGVAARRVLEARLQSAFRRACEEGTELAVVMCDLDHFKRINDTHGHGAGDRALILVAQLLDAHRREPDLLCRYGGEEFTLLLEGADGTTALEVAERLRLAVETARLEVEGRAIPLSLSAGVAAFPELHIKTATELLLLADTALYRAKHAGRNRCLLDLGQGRYRDPGGTVVVTETKAPAAPPKIFV